jgi:hypothetical protein
MCSGCRGNDCVLSVVPMFHANCVGVALHTRQIAGSRARVPRARRWQIPRQLADLIEQAKA